MASSRMALASLSRQYSNQAANLGSAAVSGHGPEAIRLWKNLSLFVATPAILLCATNTYLKHQEDHHKPRPEFVPYEHMRIRTKRFPWGDGTKSFFHNPKTNALPTGYEE